MKLIIAAMFAFAALVSSVVAPRAAEQPPVAAICMAPAAATTPEPTGRQAPALVASLLESARIGDRSGPIAQSAPLVPPALLRN